MDLILKHLTASSSSVTLSIGVPWTMVGFGLRHFLDDLDAHLSSMAAAWAGVSPRAPPAS